MRIRGAYMMQLAWIAMSSSRQGLDSGLEALASTPSAKLSGANLVAKVVNRVSKVVSRTYSRNSTNSFQ